jgi:hypothetical protein
MMANFREDVFDRSETNGHANLFRSAAMKLARKLDVRVATEALTPN